PYDNDVGPCVTSADSLRPTTSLAKRSLKSVKRSARLEDKAVPRGECLHVVERVLGYASVSFGMIAIVPMPIARRRRTHR
ncbi:MAG: hypothetical protein WCC77_17580, partial [Pseudolabrys sp.]